MKSEKLRTVILGDEYDDSLIERLRKILVEYNPNCIDKISGIGGSQELAEYKFNMEDSEIIVSIETFVGVSITGREDIVDSIVKKMN